LSGFEPQPDIRRDQEISAKNYLRSSITFHFWLHKERIDENADKRSVGVCRAGARLEQAIRRAGREIVPPPLRRRSTKSHPVQSNVHGGGSGARYEYYEG
ncbi:unnamed protein product, partial [Ascophyllum nodosum]